MKTAEDFQQAALKIKPLKWTVHRCSMCNYPCGFVFNQDYTKVGYDAGCDCVTYNSVTPRAWDALAEHYNMQQNPDTIMEMNGFWGFNNE